MFLQRYSLISPWTTCLVILCILDIWITAWPTAQQTKPQLQSRRSRQMSPVTSSSSAGNLSESAESKVERLGQAFKRNVRELREKSSCLDLVFLVDESSSVGANNFLSELRFVRKMLSDFPVAPENTRVALVTFSSKTHVVTRVDHISAPKSHQHKCSLFNQEIPAISYRGGGTYTKGAFQRAAQILRQSRANATKAIFLITDGYSNGGDPRPVAAALRERGVEIFTLGIWQGNIRELHDMASYPKDQHCYLVHNFAEFEALARRALHEDLPTGSYIQEDLSRCSSLCEAGKDCCDLMASCRCGTHTGQYDCICEKGYYGKGLQHECTACPTGTYKPEGTPGGLSTCLPCPDPQHTSQPGSTSLSDCVCKPGYQPVGMTCQVIYCPALSPPENGFFVQNVCNNHFDAACGVRCQPGFDIQGTSIRLCQADGTWSGSPAICRVRSCPPLSQPQHGLLRCSDGGASYRAECQVSCERGYRLEGDSRLTCQANSQWNRPQPRCVEVRCPPIAALTNILLSPPACGKRTISPGSVCLLTCLQGYSLQGNRKAVCMGSGNWTANAHKAICKDTEPPWIQCPGDVVAETDERRGAASVSWNVPNATDNSKEEIVVQVKPVYTPPQLFPIGKETITYIATDRSGNQANCSFTVTVIDTEPPVIDRCRSPPTVQATDTETAVVWEVPQFSDNSGGRLTVTSSHTPGSLFQVGDTLVQYTATDAAGNSRTCNLTITVQGTKCEQPYIPVNGEFICSEEDEGVNCTLHCKDGYSFTHDAVHSYFCANGVWVPPYSADRPDCSVNRIANSGFKPFEMLFKASRCEDVDLVKSFTGEFNTKLEGILPNICSNDNVTCKLEVMSQGHCLEYNYDYENGFSIAPGGWGNSWGAQGSQDYAYFDSGFATGTRQLASRQRDSNMQTRYRTKRHRKITGPTKDQKIQIFFNITASIPLPLSRNDSIEVANQKRLLRTLEQLTNRLKRTLAKQPLSSFHVSSEMIVADPKSLESKKASLFCRPGSMLKGRMCVQCPVGTYFSLEYNECESCWLGSYQDQEGQLECKSCPEGTSTAYLHSRSLAECKGQCKPGSHSLNGLEICESCPLGHFQPGFGARECLICPDETSTVTRGAVDEKECGVPCSAGHFSRTGLVPCYPCPRDYYQPEHGRSYCLSCPFYGTTTVSGATTIQHCSSFGSSFLPKEESVTAAPEVEANEDYQASSQVFHECFLNPCQNKGTCEEVGAGYVCTCMPGFTGAKCEIDIDECDSAPCQNGGLCKDGMGEYQCQCKPGFLGSLCEAEVNECISSPCLNEGVCVDEVNKFTCSCASGFTGPRCEMEINECLSNPCLNGGVCEDLTGGYTCNCAVGFSGDHCEVNIDECYSTPCLNGGSCLDAINNFRCQCVEGYRGRLCEVDVDECDPNPCVNGASCLDGLGSYTCRCLPGFNGTRCETEMSSAFNLDFEVSGIHGYVMMDGVMPALTEITCTFWMRSSDTTNYGTPVSYAVEGSDNAFLLIDYNGWVLYVNGKERITDCPAVNTGHWYHIGVSWRSWDGDWRIYINGKPSDGGKGLSVGTTIPGGGALVLGQDQDQRGEGFNPVESFVGSISQLNIWDRVLTPQQVKVLASSCPASHVTHRGNVLAWPDFLNGAIGRVKVNLSSIFCADCPKLENAVPHMHTSTVEVNPGALVQLSCDPGFFLVGEPVLQCQNKGEWSHPLPSCERVSCGAPRPLENGLFHGTDFYAGSSVVYQCNVGFYLLGDAKVHCSNSGKWGGNPPACLDVDECALGSDCDGHASCQNTDGSYTCTCVHPYSGDGKNCTEPVKCENPGSPEFGHRQGSNFLMGSDVVFGCENGYELDGSSRLHCLGTGNWDNPVPYCRALSCPTPTVPENSIMKGNNFTYGSKVTFSCMMGFLPQIPYEFQCLASLRWSGSPPVCHPVTCGGPPTVENADYTFQTNTYLSTVVYTCVEGYRPQGSMEVVCEATGEWSRPVGRCVRVLCSEPPALRDAVTLGDNYELGNKVHYVCKEGYTLIGPETRECLQSGQWSDSSAQCVPRSCGPPPDIDHAEPFESHQLYGDTANYYCTDGYTAGNNTKMVCNAQGVWAPPDGMEAPRCIANFCLRPPDLPHAILDSVNKPKYASTTEVSYKCEEGFMLNTTATLRCLMGGEWEPSPYDISCIPVRCSTPESIDRGYVSGNNYSFGAVVAYSCHTGFMIRGEKRRTCKANGEWGGALPTCAPVSCPPPLRLDNGQVRGRLTFNSKITYACNPGYRLVGRPDRVCQANRQWSNSDPPTCVILTCDPPPDVVHGHYRGSQFQVGRKVEYICDEGYELIGDAIWTCLKYGKWDKTRRPRCSPVQCPEPPLEENHLVLKGLDSESGTVELSCEDGYILEGARILRCTPSQEWNDTFPVCKQVSCGPLPEVSFGGPVLSSVLFPFGSVVTYTCMDGFTLKKEGSVSCLASGHWSSPYPECIPVECPQPVEISNGIVDVQGLMYLSKALYSCKTGYNLVGNSTVLCGEKGLWIGGVPSCRPVECSVPKQIANGKVIYTKLQFGHSATFSCRRGYRLQGPETLMCLASGEWDVALPACVQISCTPPQPIENGFVEGQDHSFGVTIFYSCFPGFQLVGQDHLTCEEFGWSSSVPVCVPSDCGLPPHIDFGEYVRVIERGAGSATTSKDTGTFASAMDLSFLHGTMIEYRCHKGYDLTSHTRLVCQEDGGWNGTAPSCVPAECETPPNPDHGWVNVTDASFGSIVRYTCEEGYELEGEPVRECVTGRLWTNDAPICRPVCCGDPGAVDNGTTHGDAFVYPEVLHFECSPGFVLKGSDTIACQADGKWNGQKPQCEPVSCGPPQVPREITFKGEVYTYRNEIELNCQPGFILQEKSISVCQADGTWSHKSLTCVTGHCKKPSPIPNGRVLVSEFNFNSKITYECDEGYTLNGDATSVCQSDGQWDKPVPRCDIISCDPPEDISHGFLNGSSFNYDDVVEYVCFDGYEVVGDPILRCSDQGLWVGTVPHCRPCTCPLPVVKFGVVLGRDHACGDRVRFQCNDGYKLLGPLEAVCEKGGVWSPGMPVCGQGRCTAAPPTVPNAVLQGGSATFQDVVIYRCRPGYQLKGFPHLSCGRDGRWGDPRFSCEPVSCGKPPAVAHAQVVEDTFTFPNQIRYRCDDGYEQATQTAHLSCQSDGTWSKHSIRCRPKPCQLPTTLSSPHMVITGRELTPLGGTISLSCPPGFQLQGPGVTECQLGGRWAPSLSTVSCELVVCEKPPPVDYGVIEGDSYNYGDFVMYSCLPGFDLKGDSIQTCQGDGSWSGTQPVCVGQSCGPPPTVQNAQVQVTGETYLHNASYDCNVGLQLVGPKTLICLANGTWSLPAPTCEAKACESPKRMLHGKVQERHLNTGRAVEFQCDKGYDLVGDPVVVCMGGNTWSSTFPTCQPKSCPTPPGWREDSTGNRSQHAFHVGQSVRVTCPKGQQVKGSGIITCRPDQTWTPFSSVCERVSCGPPLHVTNGVVRGAVFQFGDVAVYSCFGGYAMEGVGRSRCLENGTWTPPPTCRAVCWLQCQNGGVCQRPNTCSCPEGWMGRLCEEPICILPCLNGGRCVAPYQCECPTGWTGTRCHTAVCSSPCLNGGRCIRPNRCHCSSGWGGHDCSRKRRSGYYHF
ncbi:sushi, von Willebrand factor type A, EGF and pentraxin domain-containing protein 1 isoform X2 [Anabas testudineus]|uniref:sushi, von Willebrand factor type A, EGF and pentraxin domain-containing protein 1 isoform X2 n=1 Tax=Anabas testudineus TaxID=64144 RepID=UPI000E454971|nr:sushi, von Willebrand factor type A, EGF and pentraxin domain-containing protein 1 isoform X2 [Anabas testudineus]